jgi:predicted N-formylglutamate amidohydrolase
MVKSNKPIIHLSIHSFTPVWKGKIRTTDIGLLFDPDRKPELNFCEKLKSNLAGNFPDFTIDWNKPYAGVDDGFTTYLRLKWPEQEYLGIEIEVNQKYANQTDLISSGLITAVQRSLT